MRTLFFSCNVLNRVYVHMIPNSKNVKRFTAKFPHIYPLSARTSPASTWATILYSSHIALCFYKKMQIYILISSSTLILHKMCQLYRLPYLLLNHLITALDVSELLPMGTESHPILYHSCMVFHYLVRPSSM